MKMHRFLPVFVFLLTACTIAGDSAVPPLSSSSLSSLSSSSSLSSQSLLQVTPELSIDSLAQMTLVGTGLTLTKVLTENDAYTRYEIRYLSNGLVISGILNIPKNPAPHPLIIFNHGYIDPDVYTIGRGLKREQDYMAREGFAVLHTDYRKHGASDPSPDVRDTYDAGLEYAMDSINAIHAVRAANIPGIDATRIGMLGHSMGGGVSLNIATAFPDLVDAFVLYAPVHSDAWENYERWRRDREPDDKTTQTLGTRETNPNAWDALSSGTFLGRIQSPIAIFHGTNDKDVPISWSHDLDSALTEAKKEHFLVEYEGEGHEFGPKWNAFMRHASDFFGSALLHPAE